MALDTEANPADLHSELCDELLAGLRATPKTINPKFFYDERGSELFEQICETTEYYPARTEIDILQSNSSDIAAAIGPGCELLEPGAGACEKVRYLLGDLQPAIYLPQDISGPFLVSAAESLHRDFPELHVQPLVADFSDSIPLPERSGGGRRVIFYPGSTVGNFQPPQALGFLERAAEIVGSGGGLLIGVDLHKDVDVLEAAYNDARGVTAAFNRNVLHHANRLLEADFDPAAFSHVAFYNAEQRRIEMHLESTRAQTVHSSGGAFEFAEGERIQTEFSYKYSLEDFADLAGRAGFARRGCWLDPNGWFSVQYFEAD